MQIVTKDLFEAAYLLSQGMRVVRLFGSNRTVLLCIEGGDSLSQLKASYRKGQAEINVRDLKREFKEVRDLVFSKRRELQKGQALTL